MSQTAEQHEATFAERVLVLAPTGRDTPLACAALSSHGVRAEPCRGMEELCSEIGKGAGAALIAQESLTLPALDQLVKVLSKQPAWSDFPVIILTTAETRNSQFSAFKTLTAVGNYTLIERPLRIVTLISVAYAALKARRRQYEIRDSLEAMRENEERLRDALTAANMGSWRANLSTGMVIRDANLNRILGQESVETTISMDCSFQRVQEQDRAAAAAAWQRAIETKGVYESEFRLVREDGTLRWLREQGRFVAGRLGCPDFITGVTLDITERKRAEELLKQADRRKDEFLANMSHEIRSPMTSILGYSDILLDHLKDPDDIECVRTIKQSGNYLLELINDILDLSKIQSGELKLNNQLMSLPRVFAEVYSLMAIRAKEKGLPLTLNYQGALPENIRGDRIRIRQILINLLSNAIKFTERGSVQIIGRFVAEYSLLEIEVIDTGIGISKEMQERLFQPFTQADTSVTRGYGGTGLGLAITKRLIDMMGGAITVLTELNRGTTFRVSIPVEAVDPTTVIVPRSLQLYDGASVNSQLNCRVLIIDDRVEIRYLVRQMIEQAGGEVSTVGDGLSGIEAVRQAEKEGRTFDLILMDIQMPGLDGYEATRSLRSQGFKMPIIGLTANAMKGHREKCLEAGCDNYLSKPIDRNTLIEMVASYTLKDHKGSDVSSASISGISGLNILLVDDSERACKATGMLLEKAGHRVQMAFDGKSALDAAHNFAANVVLLDFKLPDMSGYELLGRLKEINRLHGAKFFAVSGYAREDIQRGNSQVDFDYFITKPVNISELQKLFFKEFDIDIQG